MTHRGALTHDVRRVSVAGEKTVTTSAGTLLLFCHTGAVTLPSGETLQALDSAVGQADGGVIGFRSAVLSTLYVIGIAPR